MWRCDKVGGLGEHVTKLILWFLRYTFVNFLLYSWTDFDDLRETIDSHVTVLKFAVCVVAARRVARVCHQYLSIYKNIP